MAALLSWATTLAVQASVPRLAPRLAVAMASQRFAAREFRLLPDRSGKLRGEVRDPWGAPLVAWRPPPPAPPTGRIVYSLGPNGRDEERGGDDVVPSAEELGTGRRLLALRSSLALLGAWLLFWGLSETVWRPRRSSQLREALLAVLLAIPTTLFLPLAVVSLALGSNDLTPLVDELARLGWHPVQAAGSAFLACYLGCLAWRLLRPSDEGPPDPSPQPA